MSSAESCNSFIEDIETPIKDSNQIQQGAKETQETIIQVEKQMSLNEELPEAPPSTPTKLRQRLITDFLLPTQANNTEEEGKAEDAEAQGTTRHKTSKEKQKKDIQQEETIECTSTTPQTQAETRKEI